MLLDRNVLAHRATHRPQPRRLHPVAAWPRTKPKSCRSRSRRAAAGAGLARALLDLHLRRLAGLGARAVFLEVDEDNVPARAALSARRLSRGRPARRLLPADAAGATRAALVLRRDLVR